MLCLYAVFVHNLYSSPMKSTRLFPIPLLKSRGSSSPDLSVRKLSDNYGKLQIQNFGKLKRLTGCSASLVWALTYLSVKPYNRQSAKYFVF